MPEVAVGKDGLFHADSAEAKGKRPSFAMSRKLLEERRDLAELPLQMGKECKTDAYTAAEMRWRAADLRTVIDSGQLRGDPQALRRGLERKEFDHDFGIGEAVPTLMQTLQPLREAHREVLVWQLAEINGLAATRALARLAVFDAAPDIRLKALKALAERRREDARDVFLAGLRYPWLPAAQHAAEALVALGDREAIPLLEQIEKEPAPDEPFAADEKSEIKHVREVVRINHLSNCLLCHAPDPDGKGFLPAAVPPSNQALPATVYYSLRQSPPPLLVRADITYLRQDFSIGLPVNDHGPWPEVQRFDFVVRTRQAIGPERERTGDPRFKEAIRFALAELRGLRF
jgi:hypothetical protein